MSTITREFTKEQLQHIIETDHVQCGDASALARMALAGMEVEPVAESKIYGPYIPKFIGPAVWAAITDELPPELVDKSVWISLSPQPLTTSERAELENYRNAQQVVQDENGLLPCPFCGSPAEHYPDGDMEGYSVMCGNKNGDCDSWIFGFSTPEEAEKSWNTRATMHSGAVKDGWVMVPREATSEMINSAMRDNETGGVAEIYELMIAAAPKQEAE